MNSMLLAVYPGDVGLNHCDKSTGVEVPPLTLAMVVGGALFVTVRTLEPPIWLMGQFQGDLHLFDLEVDLLNAPGSG